MRTVTSTVRVVSGLDTFVPAGTVNLLGTEKFDPLASGFALGFEAQALSVRYAGISRS